MFSRNISKFLQEWKDKKNRKPLVLRGARQVGKTSAVHMFGKECFQTYIPINLEIKRHADLFSRMLPIPELPRIVDLQFSF